MATAKRAPFLPSLLAALALMLTALLAAVYYPAVNTRLFENALLGNVDAAALETGADSLRAFARETMDYLTGRRKVWNPQISLRGVSARQFISQDFRSHMANVRRWTRRIPTLLEAGFAFALALLLFLGVAKRGIRPGGWYLGAGLPVGLTAAVGVWAYVDFVGMWGALHRALIPDGIFPAGDPVMQLFPEALFASYLPWVLGLFLLLAALIFAMPPVWNLIHRKASQTKWIRRRK